MSKPVKILVVDDEPDFERLIRQRFRKEIKNGNFSFLFAGNGQEAQTLLEANSDIDIVLTDINMPVMDGLSLLSYLRKDKPELIAVIISAYGDMPKLRAAMNLGAFDFVIKPIDFEDLKATIQKSIRELEVVRQAAKAQELTLMNEQLRQIDRMKSQFLTNISHEFRTPVTIIDGMADQILAKPERWLSRGVQSIKRNSALLLDLVDQILDLAKLDDGSMKINLIHDNIIDHLQRVIAPFYGQAESKNLKLILVNQLPELKMDYDPAKVQRVVSNLLSNAIKFNRSGGSIWIEIGKADTPGPEASPSGAAEPNGWLRLQVKNTGAGISSDQFDFIFNRFYQVDGSSTRGAEGAGLGLALVKELLALMDGQISVSSEEGETATFEVTLPIRRQANLHLGY